MAHTSLYRQLKSLETPQSSIYLHKKTSASFLFSPKDAAKVSTEDYYAIGLEGLEGLIELDQQFKLFKCNLFDITAKHFQRTVQTTDANKKLNQNIRQFLLLSSPYFLFKCCHKALEWLIHRFLVHQFNVNELMFLILPYHESMLFVRMLHILDLSQEKSWSWLDSIKKEQVPLNKITLFRRIGDNSSFLNFVGNMPVSAIKECPNVSSFSTLFAFYCSSVIGGLQNTKSIIHHVTFLLPSLLTCLSSNHPDAIAAAFMIIGYLSTKVQLSEMVVHIFFNKLSRIQCEKLYNEATILMVLLGQNISKEIKFPNEALNNLCVSKWFLPNLRIASNKKILVVPFVTCILDSALILVLKGNESMMIFVENLLKDSYIDHSNAEDIFNCLLEQFNKQSTQNIQNWYADLLRQLERSFPKAFDSVVSKVTKVECSKAEALNHLLGVSTSRIDLYELLVHPNENIRVNSIQDILQKGNTEELGWINHTLLERFNDDYVDVVLRLLQPSTFLKNVDPDQLLEKLIVVITKFQSNKDVLNLAVPLLLESSSKEEVVKLLVTMPVILELMENKNVMDKIYERWEMDPSLLWEFLKKRKSLPTVSESLKALNRFEVLKVNDKYWFITALLIAENLPTQIDLPTLNSIVLFIKQYCKRPQIGPHKLKQFYTNSGMTLFINSLRSTLPLEGAIHCTMALTKPLVILNTWNQNWIDFSIPENECFLTIIKIIYQFCNDRKYFDKNKFIKQVFPSTAVQINFVLNTLIYDEVDHEMLHFVIDIVKQPDLDFKRECLEKTSTVVPILLILLSSKNESIRRNVITIIKLLMKNSDSQLFYHQFVVELYNFQQELIIDYEQIAVFLFIQLSPAKEVKNLHDTSKRRYAMEVLNQIFSIILCNDTPLYAKVQLLQIFECVQSKNLFEKLKPLAIAIQDKEKQNEDESKMLSYILKRFNSEIMESIFNDKGIWEFLVKGLNDHTSEVKGDNLKQATCPATILLDQISTLFDNVPNPKVENQEKLLLLILTSTMDTESIDVTTATAKLFKKISLNCNIAVSLLTSMLTVVDGTETKKKLLPSFKILETDEWKRGVCLLEQIQNKKKLTSIPLLIPVLFNILKRCLQFEEQGPAEYIKQLILSTILNCSEHITKNKQIISQDMWQVDTIVNCLRASHNPQTHHHALIALTHLARIVSEKVLNDIMSIFTFIGSTVVRQDDTYSYQIITNIIDSIIPIIIESKVEGQIELKMTQVCRVFATALLDIPEHRKVSTLTKLMLTLKNGEFLWLFLCLIFENHVLRPNELSDLTVPKTIETMPKNLETAMQVCLEFPSDVILNTCLKILQHVNSLPVDKDAIENMGNKIIFSIFNVQQNSGKQFRHYKYTLIMFLSSLLSNHTFVQRIADLSEDEHFLLTDIFKRLVEQTLVHLKIVLNQVEVCAQYPTAKYWKVILNHSYDVLDKINALLPIKLFLRIVKQLMNNKVETIRRKSLEIFAWRLQQSRPIPSNALLELLEPLVTLFDSLDLNELSQENQLTMQAVIYALKLMTRHLGSDHKDTFKLILVKVSKIFRDVNPSNWAITGSLALCIGELVSILKQDSLEHLPIFMETLIKMLKVNKAQQDGVELVLISAIIALQKIVDNIVLFITPYLNSLIYNICTLSAYFDNHQSETQKSLRLKLNSLRLKISVETPKRILLPAVTFCYKQFVNAHDYNLIPPLMISLSDGEITSKTFTTNIEEFFLMSLAFRAEHNDIPMETINLVEDATIQSLIIFVMKLTETSFRTFFVKIANTEHHIDNPAAAITFYRVCYKLSESLRSLIYLFATTILENGSAMLNHLQLQLVNKKVLDIHTELLQSGQLLEKWSAWKEVLEEDDQEINMFEGQNKTEKACLLIDSILQSLLSLFTYDPEKSLSTTNIFYSLVNPLLLMLSYQIGGVEVWKNRCETLLIPCLGKIVRSICDDLQWKTLNKKVLLLTRHFDPLVRIAAVQTTLAIATELNEEFLPLLPETVPYLAELLEDDDEEVEQACRKVVVGLQDVTAEKINEYF